jgi:hypothetical protein
MFLSLDNVNVLITVLGRRGFAKDKAKGATTLGSVADLVSNVDYDYRCCKFMKWLYSPRSFAHYSSNPH